MDRRYGVTAGLDRNAPDFWFRRCVAMQRFLGDAYVVVRAPSAGPRGEERIRERVHDALAACQPGGGYFLGTDNSVANDLPLDHYLAMLDEGRRFPG